MTRNGKANLTSTLCCAIFGLGDATVKAKHRETMEMVERLGACIRELRTQSLTRPMSQGTLAKRVGYSRATLSSIESASRQVGTPNLHLDVLVGVAKAFGVRLSDLLALAEGSEFPVSKETLQRIAKAIGASERRVGRSADRLDCHYDSARDRASGPGTSLHSTFRASPRLGHASDQASRGGQSGEGQARFLEACEDIAFMISELGMVMKCTSESIFRALSGATQWEDEQGEEEGEGEDEDH